MSDTLRAQVEQIAQDAETLACDGLPPDKVQDSPEFCRACRVRAGIQRLRLWLSVRTRTTEEGKNDQGSCESFTYPPTADRNAHRLKESLRAAFETGWRAGISLNSWLGADAHLKRAGWPKGEPPTLPDAFARYIANAPPETIRASRTDPLQAFAERLAQSQEDLPADAARVLREHASELYINDPTLASAEEAHDDRLVTRATVSTEDAAEGVSDGGTPGDSICRTTDGPPPPARVALQRFTAERYDEAAAYYERCATAQHNQHPLGLWTAAYADRWATTAAMLRDAAFLQRAQEARPAPASSEGWFPIATAPKDRRIVLYRPSDSHVGTGEYDDDFRAAVPQPFWRDDGDDRHIWSRAHPPTLWQPLLAPPVLSGETPTNERKTDD